MNMNNINNNYELTIRLVNYGNCRPKDRGVVIKKVTNLTLEKGMELFKDLKANIKSEN